ncbi:HAD family hydrolase [Mucilaginibacter pedocola]|nr:HAD family phosphatase [Mucilaginibacter pedocola]
MKTAKALLFDLDGTLIDSENSHYRCWNALVTLFGHNLPHDVYMASYSGVALAINAQRLIDEFSLDISLKDMIAKREELMLETFRTDDIVHMPYALGIINHFNALGVQLVLVTSSSADEVAVILERANLMGYFGLIITRDDVSNAKPHPEPYLKAVEKLGLTKEECIVIEDTLTGVDSATNAGIACVAVHPDPTDEFKAACRADALCNGLREVQRYLEDEYSFGVVSGTVDRAAVAVPVN